MPIGETIVDVVSTVFREVIVNTIGEAIGEGVSAVAKVVRKTSRRDRRSRPRLSVTDERMQQLFTDALVAAAHMDDATLDDSEREIIARGLRSLGSLAEAADPMVARAETRVAAGDPWAIVESAIREADPRSRETFACVVVAVAMAGTGSRAHIDKVLQHVRDAAGLDDRAWDTVLTEARVRVRLVRGHGARS